MRACRANTTTLGGRPLSITPCQQKVIRVVRDTQVRIYRIFLCLAVTSPPWLYLECEWGASHVQPIQPISCIHGRDCHCGGLGRAGTGRDLNLTRPVAVTPGWSGWYGGVAAGWVGARFHAEAQADALPFPGSPLNDDFRGNGIGLGLYVGYNWQNGPWVLGVEADATGASGAKGNICRGGFFNNGVPSPGLLPGSCTRAVVTSEVTWLSTVRGRLGMTFDRTLLYATGGLAMAGVSYRMEKTDTNIERHSVRVGAVVGAGVEYMIGPALSMRLEGLYHFLRDNRSYLVDSCCANVAMKPGVQDVAVLRVGLTWRPQLF
jgi:outer membrane immunogenic protein